MSEIVTSGGIMLGIAGFFGLVLAVANRYLRVEEDPRVETLDDMLPGTNCGACGQPGCHAFAETLVSGENLPGKCSVSSSEAVQEIAAFLGVDAGFEAKRVARLRCAGGKSNVRRLADYRGWSSCRAAAIVGSAGRACPWGCLGFGDCDRACTFGAIHMDREELPVVDVDLCTACGDCVDVCPLDLFTLEPLSTRALVQCSCPLSGEAARDICRVACDACGRCAQDAEQDAIEMVAGLPVVRNPEGTTEACTYRCPTGAIQWVESNQFEPVRSRQGGETPHA